LIINLIKFNDDLLKKIVREKIKKKETMSLKELKELYKKEHDFDFGINSLRRYIREELKMRYKKLEIKNQK